MWKREKLPIIMQERCNGSRVLAWTVFQSTLLGQFSRPPQGDVVCSTTLLVYIVIARRVRKSDRAGVAAAYLQKNKMKKKFRLTGLILFIAAFTMMVSCTKDETNDTSIVGTWGCVHSYSHYWGIDYRGEEFDNEYTDEFRGDVIFFNGNGSYTASGSFWPIDERGGSWMIDGNSLILGSRTCDIQTLNETTLKLHYHEPAFEGYETEHYEWTLEFRRQ